MKQEKSCGSIIFLDGKVLLINQKNGCWGFPKGHMEQGENEIETAIRETKEETNIDVEIESNFRFETSYYVKNDILKTVVYFVAHPIDKIELKIQEAEIKKAIWVDINEVESYLMYDNIKELWNNVLTQKKEI